MSDERDPYAVLRDLVDDDPCDLDHHGYCQTHGWFDADVPCPNKRALELLAEEDK